MERDFYTSFLQLEPQSTRLPGIGNESRHLFICMIYITILLFYVGFFGDFCQVCVAKRLMNLLFLVCVLCYRKRMFMRDKNSRPNKDLRKFLYLSLNCLFFLWKIILGKDRLIIFFLVLHLGKFTVYEMEVHFLFIS